ncbi:sensor histidine kinase [Campylobacter sp. RM12327]|uniref:sensor histidine kinase n=1 Tax=Campylobacter sputorum TaxID=206 RepID=UPI000B78BBD2|nr:MULTISPECIES: sensor histidine kinase [Campylobacter]ASM39701.1 two-component system sensor histidine kinase [Campylobacter sputorum]MBE7358099.1 sensor histidine kinase [Campylobacter sp. RM11302]MBF6668911.1 sensor histidine kinase [Campylobacter sp. RM12327]MBF6673825.1 sensor histidine kinase [Campylobacter sp. RM13538]MBF6676271.1 sensor histidine kinase [Campylobacter sp. RM12321]
MKKFIKNLILNIDNYKIYHTMAIFSLVFMFLLIVTFLNIKKDVYQKIEQNRILTTQRLKYSLSLWIEEQIKSLEAATAYLQNNQIYQDENKIIKFNKNFLQSSPNFDFIHIYVDDKYFFVNSDKIFDLEHNKSLNSFANINNARTLDWYVKTKSMMKTTINNKTKHAILKERTINICTPIIDQDKFKGVVCGILGAKSLFDKIKQIKPPKHFYYFIVDESGKILTKLDNENLIAEISETCLKLDNNETIIKINNDVINLSTIDRFDWKIGVGVNNENFLKQNFKTIFEHSIVLFIFFIFFMLVLNLGYEFIIQKFVIKKNQMEILLARKSRLNEIGTLITSINHQLKQPINSLSLILSNTEFFRQNHNLNDDMLKSNLDLCFKQIELIDKSINIFRNFYSNDDAISEFWINESIKSLIFATHCELSHHNITIKFESKNDIKVVSIENFIQQILLVLIQNSKDAIISSQKVSIRQIYIQINQVDDFVEISVSDFADGIDEKLSEKIFSEDKTTNKKLGFGLGLYFAKTICVQKLKGDLQLISSRNPTKFTLNIPINLRS